jgi:hypothetical protein
MPHFTPEIEKAGSMNASAFLVNPIVPDATVPTNAVRRIDRHQLTETTPFIALSNDGNDLICTYTEQGGAALTNSET